MPSPLPRFRGGLSAGEVIHLGRCDASRPLAVVAGASAGGQGGFEGTRPGGSGAGLDLWGLFCADAAAEQK